MQPRKTKVVNIFGSAGAGKSTQAMGLVFKLRLAGYSAEYVPEYAKDLVYEGHLTKLEDQLYVFAKQNRRLERVLLQNLDYIVTDSPLLLSYFYGLKYNTLIAGLGPVITNSYYRSDNINFMLKRNHAYQQEGRMQSSEESLQDALELSAFLEKCIPNMPLHTFVTDGTSSTVDGMFQILTQE